MLPGKRWLEVFPPKYKVENSEQAMIALLVDAQIALQIFKVGFAHSDTLLRTCVSTIMSGAKEIFSTTPGIIGR